MNLDERLEIMEKGISSINEALEPLLRNASTPTFAHNGDPSENAAMLRKHATLIAEWEAVQDESDVLREELKEDKWLTVFRTVTDQADGMMSSLEKAVNRCQVGAPTQMQLASVIATQLYYPEQEFIWQVHRRGDHDPLAHSQSSLSASQRSEKAVPTFETFTSLLESFEAKKKYVRGSPSLSML